LLSAFLRFSLTENFCDPGDEEDFSLDEESEDEDISMTEDASHRFQEVKEDAKPKKAEGAFALSLVF
jgi:hypothetical protein